MPSAQFDVWSRRSIEGFVAQQGAAGLLPEPEARASAERQLEELLPDGPTTRTHHLWQVVVGDEVVGALWLRVRPLRCEVEAYVFDVEIESRLRGRGLGRAPMLAAETAGRDLEADVIRLNVFAHNTAAVRLYESLGYTATDVTLTKRLTNDSSTVTGASLVAVRDMTAEEYVAWRPRLLSRFTPDELAGCCLTAGSARGTCSGRLTPTGSRSVSPGCTCVSGRTGSMRSATTSRLSSTCAATDTDMPYSSKPNGDAAPWACAQCG